MNQEEKGEIPPGLAPRVVVSIIVFFGLLIFSIIYVAFFSSFSRLQNIAIILVAFFVAVTILGVMWAPWGIKYGRECKEKDCK